MEIDKQAVGNRIRQIRQELKLSMEKFGKLIGDLPRSTVNNWERGINLPKTETLHQIAEIGHVTNEYLLYGDQENQYILEMLQKKAGKLDPKIEGLIVDEIKHADLVSEKEMDRMIEFLLQISFHQLNKTSLLSNVSMKKSSFILVQLILVRKPSSICNMIIKIIFCT